MSHAHSPKRHTARLVLEVLEDRLTPSWGTGGAPPDFISTPPSLFTAFTLNSRNDAQGAGVITTNEVDYYYFTASVSGDYTFSATKSGGSGNKLNTELALFDSDGNRLAFNDDISPVDSNSQLAFSLVAGQSYYLAVTNKQGTQSGPKYTYDWKIQGPESVTDNSYNIDLFVNMTNAFTAAGTPLWNLFQNALARWESIITADLPSAVYQGITIDDLRIEAVVTKIDGISSAVNTLAYASPTHARSDYLPYRGTMTFDEVDFATWDDTFLTDVILHEMGHVLGVGSIWSYKGLVSGRGNNIQFTGMEARKAYQELLGPLAPLPSGLPLDSTGGHWRESTFGNELMTPYLIGTPNPLSKITIASLKDVGYTVNLGLADLYPLPAVTSSPASPGNGNGGGNNATGLPSSMVQDLPASSVMPDPWTDANRSVSLLLSVGDERPPSEPVGAVHQKTSPASTEGTLRATSPTAAPWWATGIEAEIATNSNVDMVFASEEGWRLEPWQPGGDRHGL
jgi:hypothetical protein